ncbi:MAG: sigma-70 family RNA polymerase sigma factor [Gemmatimonadaceae bacterium]
MTLDRGRRIADDNGCVELGENYVAPSSPAASAHKLVRAGTPKFEAVLPPSLSRLLDGNNDATRDLAWAEFVAQHSRLLLHVTRCLTLEHDGAMDAYVHVLDRLREQDHRRLRAYAADGRSQFSTWFVVVVRRLTFDLHRQRYGRLRDPEDVVGAEELAVRQQLVDLAASAIDVASIPQEETTNAENVLRAQQLREILNIALSNLTPEDRLVLRLKYEDNLSAREIADVMRMPSQYHAVRRINAILGRLRAALESGGVKDSQP